MKDEKQARCDRWVRVVGSLLGAVHTYDVKPAAQGDAVVLIWADKPGQAPNENGMVLEGEPTEQALENLRINFARLGYPRKPQGPRYTLEVKLVDDPRLGPSPDPVHMAGMWQHWLEPQLSASVQVLPCPHSRTELVATWEGAGGGPRHAFRFLGGVVLPTRETVGDLAHNLCELAWGKPLRPGALLRPEPLHFEQVVAVLETLTRRASVQLQEALAQAGAEGERSLWEGTETVEERERRDAAVPPTERGAFLRGITDKITEPKPRPTLPPELCVADGPAQDERKVLKRDPYGRPTLVEVTTPAVLERARQAVGGIVVDDRRPDPDARESQQDTPSLVLRRGVAVALVESPVDLALCREQGGLGFLSAGTPFVHIDPEATDEGLRLLRMAVVDELHRRAQERGK